MKPSALLLGFLLNTSLALAQDVFCHASNSLPVEYSDAENVVTQLCEAFTDHKLINSNPNAVSNEGIGGSFVSIFYNEQGCGPSNYYVIPTVDVCVYFVTHILQGCGSPEGNGLAVGGTTYDNCGGYTVEHVV